MDKTKKNNNNSECKETESQELLISLKFLEKTKNGEYADIEDNISDYYRLKAETIEIEENYFTSFS